MAVTLLTARCNGWNTDSATSVTLPSINLGSNCAVVIILGIITGTTTAPTLISGITDSAGGTSGTTGQPWVSLVPSTNEGLGFVSNGHIWGREVGGTAINGLTITVDWVDSSNNLYAVAVVKYDGSDYNPGNPYGGTLHKTVNGVGDGADSGTLSAAPGSGDHTLALVIADENSASKAAVWSSAHGTWTVLTDGTNTVTSTDLHAFSIASRTGSTDAVVDLTDVNTGSDNFSHAIVGIVVKATAGSTFTGSIATTLGAVTSDIDGNVVPPPITGSMATTLGAVTSDIDGTHVPPTITGSMATTLGAVTSHIVGTTTNTFTGSLSTTLAPTVADLNGTVVNNFTGSMAVTLAPTTADIDGLVSNTFTGLLHPTLAPVTADLNGTNTNPRPPYPVPTSISVTNQLLDQDGHRYLLKMLSSWGLAMRATNAEITNTLERFQARGFNVINFAFCGGVDSQSEWDAVQYKNILGQDFFTGTPFQSSLGPAFATTDWIVAECDRLGLTCSFALFVSYLDSGIRQEIDAATNAQMRTFGQQVGTRYPNSNIIFEVMGDNSWTASDPTGRRLDYFARGLAETRTTQPNLWFAETFANSTDGSMSMFLNSEGTDPTGYQWLHLSFNGMYWYGNDAVVQGDIEYANAVGFARDIAVLDAEPGYAQATQYTGGAGGNQPAGVRQRTWSDFIRGFSGVNWGHERWWCYDLLGLFPSAVPSDPRDVPDAVETIQAQYAFGVIDSYITDTLWAPVSTLLTNGLGTGDHKAAQGASGRAALAYFPSGTTNGSTARTIVADTTIIAGTGNVRLRWYDPTAGTFTSIAASEAQNASRSVTLPAAHGDGSRDFVLVVDDPSTTSTGLLNTTLGPVTSDIDGTVAGPGNANGTIATTLAPVTADLNGTTTVPVFTGLLSTTLGTVTSDIDGTVSGPGVITGVIHSTLAPVTADINGTAPGVAPLKLKVGASQVSKVYLGSTEIVKIYLGSTQL